MVPNYHAKTSKYNKINWSDQLYNKDEATPGTIHIKSSMVPNYQAKTCNMTKLISEIVTKNIGCYISKIKSPNHGTKITHDLFLHAVNTEN